MKNKVLSFLQKLMIQKVMILMTVKWIKFWKNNDYIIVKNQVYEQSVQNKETIWKATRDK
jgi:hypothetical protein